MRKGVGKGGYAREKMRRSEKMKIRTITDEGKREKTGRKPRRNE